MRTRHSIGGVRKQRGKWIGHWYCEGKRMSQVIGLVKEMTKSKAREEVAKIAAAARAKLETKRSWQFGEFVEHVYLPFYRRKWKHSTSGNNENRSDVHLVSDFRNRAMESFNRDELRDLLDLKASKFSFSTVDHLRWDLKAIFDLAWRRVSSRETPQLCCSPRRLHQGQRERQ